MTMDIKSQPLQENKSLKKDIRLPFMTLLEYIASRIRELRLAYGGQGLSQEVLATNLGVATNTVSRWETGVYKPAIEDLDRLARFFGVSVLDFFPPSERPANDEVAALLRAANALSDEDVRELRRYAEWRKAQSLLNGGPRKTPGRKRKDAS